MSSAQPLKEIIRAQKNGQSKGIYSICSANPFVIEACMQQAARDDLDLLIESTCNQVNQFGGYTGMTPEDFVKFIEGIAGKMHFPARRLILGGDHLGPNPWQKMPARDAMDRSLQLVRDYVSAGYAKIHLDTSMACSDDGSDTLDEEVIAQRTADLCAAAEDAVDGGNPPVYIIGTEVPVPGGEMAGSARPQVTRADAARETIELFRRSFHNRGLDSAWERVIALVVQPGVGFGDTEIYEYNRAEAAPLSRMIASVPGIVFEAHSTDYQKAVHLRQMVEDHFAILKVGPGLTFAMREAVFALAQIEGEVLGENGSRLIETAEQTMLREPKYWQAYYRGTQQEMAFARKYSLSDRIRYYWAQPELQNALSNLIQNLSRSPIPLSLISQYFPDLYEKVRQGEIRSDPAALIHARIRQTAAVYADACRGD